MTIAAVLAVSALAAAPGSATASPLHHCAGAPGGGRLAVSVSPGPGCDGAAVLARKIHAAAKRRFPRALPRHYSVDTPSPPADATPATFRFRCVVHNEVSIDRQGDQFRITTARCANQRGSRFRYSFSMA